MQRFVCIHGHFYQPPREDPWTREVKRDPSASPYHDWNERIAAECYGPNSASPLVDDGGNILEAVNNYARMSFDFGPTLLRWIESHYSELYGAILDADRESVRRFGGHGSGMAQVYNHMIVPLASQNDKRTQVRWGVKDFESRFGRYPEGVWLPETAVDAPTLEALADAEVKFTILSPKQALAVRGLGEDGWHDVAGGRIDTSVAYQVRLPSGRRFSVFFYDDGVSNRVAFGDLLLSGTRLASELLGRFRSGDSPQLVSIASDGETYGHHHRTGHRALTRSLWEIEKSGAASLGDYGQFLSIAPPSLEGRLAEPSSWSCPHGVERWRSNCGCGSEMRRGYNQEWRAPLRRSLDWLRDSLSELYAAEGDHVFVDANGAREEYGPFAGGGRERTLEYLKGRAKPGLSDADLSKCQKLLEMVESSALMYASCAWFWEDISRQETRQMLRFASRAMEICRDVSGTDLVPTFSRMLGAAVPNARAYGSGPSLFSELTRREGGS